MELYPNESWHFPLLISSLLPFGLAAKLPIQNSLIWLKSSQPQQFGLVKTYQATYFDWVQRIPGHKAALVWIGKTNKLPFFIRDKPSHNQSVWLISSQPQQFGLVKNNPATFFDWVERIPGHRALVGFEKSKIFIPPCFGW